MTNILSQIRSNLANTIGITGGTTTYNTIGELPLSGNDAGDQAFVIGNNRLYIWSGSGWYNIALINSSPTFSQAPNATYDLDNTGIDTIITLIATDPEGFAITYTAVTDSNFDTIGTVSQDSSVFTVSASDSAVANSIAGSGVVTFKATDGTNIASELSTFSLTFGPDWSVAPTESKLVASDAQSLDWFGWHSSISDDGNYAIVGAFGEDPLNNQAGAAYIYVRSGSTWTQQAKLIASPAAAFNDYFGFSVDINSDGTYAIIGAINGDNGSVETGAAYVFTRSGTTWTQQAKIAVTDAGANPQAGDYFGYSVRINSDGTTAIIGANQADISVPNEGVAFIYVRSGTTWSFQWRLYATDRQQDDEFGSSVSISSDGNYALIGARYEDTDGIGAGAAYIWTRSGTNWSQQQKIQASDAGAVSNQWFGESVSINSDATYAVVGAYNNGGGAAYVFTRSGSTWTEQQKIVSSDLQAGDRFGYSVTISGDGQYIGIGAYDEDTGGSLAGAVYVFERSGATWTELRKIQASDVQAGDEFGRGLSMSSDGKYLITGARDEDGGAGDTIPDAGAAYIYEAS